MSELRELMKEIERLRSKMIHITEGKYYSHPEVVAASQDLDVVLNKYQEILEEQKKPKTVEGALHLLSVFQQDIHACENVLCAPDYFMTSCQWYVNEHILDPSEPWHPS